MFINGNLFKWSHLKYIFSYSYYFLNRICLVKPSSVKCLLSNINMLMFCFNLNNLNIWLENKGYTSKYFIIIPNR